MIKKIKGSLFIKVFITTAILLTGVSFLVYLILAWYTPKTYSNTLNATLDEQTKIFISEISQMPMEETGGIFDNFLDYQNVDRMELFEENGNRINLPTERSADNDVVIETNHQISEIKEISETDAQSLMLKNNPIGEDYTSQE